MARIVALLSTVVVCSLAFGLPLLAPLQPAAADPTATLPPGFVDEHVTSVKVPTAVAFRPDGRMLLTTQRGQLYVVDTGSGERVLAADLASRICANIERGLLGVAVDPDFDDNRFVYLYYTLNAHSACPTTFGASSPTDPHNRVSRFTMSDDRLDLASERVLIDEIHSTRGNHNAGDLEFGKDGFLYVTVGDGAHDYAGDSGSAGHNDAARDPHVLLGKILRVTRHGAIPARNPYADTGDRCNTDGRTTVGRQCQETFASGLRNPFRFAFDPNAAGTRFFINDVGQNTYEEINEGAAGADYGWNYCEASHDNPDSRVNVACDEPPYTAPVFEYAHTSGCSAVTGGAFVPDGLWPGYDGAYLYGDYACGTIFALARGGGEYRSSEFATGLGANTAVHLRFGPVGGDQALYYTTYGGGRTGDGQVRRVRFTGTANRPPNAVLSATPTSGDLPLAVAFDASESTDPDDDAISEYVWDFGDGATRTTASPTTSYTYEAAGSFVASVVARDARGARSDPATVRIDGGNRAPVVTIDAPPPGTTYAVDELLTPRGGADDPEDGPLPGSALEWEVLIHHHEHTHPLVPPTPGSSFSFRAPDPEDLPAVATTWLEVRLTATDSQGLTTTAVRRLDPRTVRVDLASTPPDVTVAVNGTNITTPASITSVEGYGLTLEAPAQATVDDVTYTFASWSNGGAREHRVTTGSSREAYTATYTGPMTSGDALFVVGNAQRPSVGDTKIRSRLGALGYEVTTHDDDGIRQADASGRDLVVVSSSVAAKTVGKTFTPLAVPVIVYKGALYDDMGLTGSASAAKTFTGQTRLTIVDPSLKLAAGLSGTVTTTTAKSTYQGARPGPAATVAATLAGRPAQAAIFGYVTNDAMYGRVAPARRVGLFLTNTAAARLSTNGGALFDAAVEWADHR